MVVNIEGFIKYSSIHEGNYSDTSDISTLLEKLSGNTSAAKPIVVMDAGIATEKNLNLNREGVQVCSSEQKKNKRLPTCTERKRNLFTYQIKKIITAKAIKVKNIPIVILKVESPAKGIKEQGIKNRLEQGFEKNLHLIKQSLYKPRGIKKVTKVQQRIGRAKQKYPSVHHLYIINT